MVKILQIKIGLMPIKILNKYDLELWDIGEGMVTIRELPHLYYDMFKDYVTNDYKEYLKITSKENEEHYVADSGLCITLEELDQLSNVNTK